MVGSELILLAKGASDVYNYQMDLFYVIIFRFICISNNAVGQKETYLIL